MSSYTAKITVSAILEHAGFPLLVVALSLPLIWVARRLVFHPLARFPGPKLAALTSLYEDYYEVYGEANYDYIWKIKKMHAKYGPVVRINPHEIHINDPGFYPVLNSFKGKWDKDPHTAAQFANPHSSVGTVDHDLHKKRKAAIQPFFAKQKIYELEPVIVEKSFQLSSRLHDYRVSGKVVPMRQALKCFCVDTIAEYCFAKSGDMIDKPDFAADYWHNFAKGLDAGMRARYLPKWFLPTVKVAPAWIRASVGPGVEYFELWHKEVQASVNHLESKVADSKVMDSEDEVSVHRTIFQELLNSSRLPQEEKVRPRLVQEGAAMIGAGGETTSQILGIIIYSILADQSILERLRRELKDVPVQSGSSLPSLRDLETLPYLTGSIKEGLRLRTGKIGRQQRVPKDQPIFYNGLEIKPGTICSMTPAFSQIEPSIFPNPHSFQPSRWVGITDEERIEMDRHMVPFSKGTRMCTGMSLAMAMLYICIAVLVMDLDMELYETGTTDNEMAVDTEKHYPLKHSRGLRIRVISSRKLQNKQ